MYVFLGTTAGKVPNRAHLIKERMPTHVLMDFTALYRLLNHKLVLMEHSRLLKN
jgi:hypothetical protein